MKQYYFIDCADVRHQVPRILPYLQGNSQIYIYYPKNSTVPMLTFDDVKLMNRFKCITLVGCYYGARVFPMQMASHIGGIIRGTEDATFTVISDNTSFSVVSNFLEYDAGANIEFITPEYFCQQFECKNEDKKEAIKETATDE